MRRKILICVAVLGAIVLFARLVWQPVFTESVSSNGTYEVQVRTRSGWGLHNVPEYVTLTIKKKSSLQKATIYTQIDNDDRPLSPEDNIHMVWESNRLIIVLLGYDQAPEVITISLEKGFPYERHQYDIPRELSNAILEKYRINQVKEGDGLGVIRHNVACADGYFALIRETKRRNQPQGYIVSEIYLTQERSGQSYRINMSHSDSGTVVATVCAGDGTYIQTIREENVYSSDTVSFRDINLDGYADLQFNLGGTRGTLNREHVLYIWNEDDSRFVKVICESEIYYYDVFDGYIMIWAIEDESETVLTRKYVWQGFNTLVLEDEEAVMELER